MATDNCKYNNQLLLLYKHMTFKPQQKNVIILHFLHIQKNFHLNSCIAKLPVTTSSARFPSFIYKETVTKEELTLLSHEHTDQIPDSS